MIMNRILNLAFGNSFPVDLVSSISRNLPLNDGLWFEIVNSTNIAAKEFRIPHNAYRAVLEVYVSFHENDDSWYTNMLDEYLAANNLTSPGNGPFREVVATLDGERFLGFSISVVWPEEFSSFINSELHDLMESKGGKKKSSSSKSLFYEAPLGYSIEDVRPNGGIKKFRSAAYSNCARKPS
ncbi:hypothetical protein K1719_040437 [Acacia pycnantha]|nr:hypothetical protein K1719_040437 [Acacia pycnantha]